MGKQHVGITGGQMAQPGFEPKVVAPVGDFNLYLIFKLALHSGAIVIPQRRKPHPLFYLNSTIHFNFSI